MKLGTRIPDTIIIEDNNFSNAWARSVSAIRRNGVMIRASDKVKSPLTKDIELMVVLHRDGVVQIENSECHPMNPFKSKAVNGYKDEYTYIYVTEHHELEPEEQFEYLYMDRFINYPIDKSSATGPLEQYVHPYDNWNVFDEDDKRIVPIEECDYFDQIAWLHDVIREEGISRQHQIVTWITGVDNFSDSPPCLQRIQVRCLKSKDECIEQGCKRPLEVTIDFRSRDIYGAFQPNDVGIVGMLNEYVCGDEFEIVKLTDYSKSAHIYEGDWDKADKVQLLSVMRK